MIENEISFYLVKRRGYELEINRMWHPAVICITIQRTLSVAKVRYLIGDKECFKIFYPRFFAWVNLFLLNLILLYSLLFPFQSIQTYVVRVPVF